jgi:hypothetical protein
MKTAIINNQASIEDLAGPDNERRLLTRDNKRELTSHSLMGDKGIVRSL